MTLEKKYTHLWNDDMTTEERERLMPFMIECQIQHLEQGKRKAIIAHAKLLKDFNDHINNLKSDLRKYGDE